MKKSLSLFTGFLAFTFLPFASAGEKSFPAKDSVLTYVAPDDWKTEKDAKDGSISINSPDERVSINFAPIPIDASMEIFEKMLPEMVKALGEGAKEVDKPKEHSEDGLTGYTATYSGKIEGKPAICIMILFKGGEGHSVLGNVVVADPETLSKEDNAAIGAFMKSLKGAAK
ncbi:MAG: hypothetical protein ABIP20_15885 [Chthoniobacteraceae bacterium]